MPQHTIELTIKRAGEGPRGVDPHAFTWESLTYERVLSDGSWVQSELVWKRDLRGPLQEPDSPAAAAQLSAVLGRFLDELQWPEEEVGRAAQEGPELTLELCFAADELFALPWEHVQVDGTALGLLPGVHLRFRRPGALPAAPTDHEHGRVLIASAGRVPRREHEQALSAALEAGSMPPPKRLRDVSLEGLATGLAAPGALSPPAPPITVLHLLAHGVQLPDGSMGVQLDQPVDGRTLAQTLGAHRSTLRLVVLCVCRSADPGQVAGHLGSLAQELHACGIESVVASRQPLSVDGSVVLARSLFSLLAASDPPASLERALQGARTELRETGHHQDALSITLFSHCRHPDTRPLVVRPYRGLSAFGAPHRRFFFGRDAELLELQTELMGLIELGRPRLQVVEGRSGSGKTSLVRCGLVSALEATGGWTTETFVPSAVPGAALGVAVERLEAREPGLRRLLVVDQFEEIFTTPSWSAEDRAAFVQRLWALASAPEGTTSVVCTMRTDVRGRCGEVLLEAHEAAPGQVVRRYLDRLFVDARHQVYVPRMGADELRAAIERPAQAVGLGLEPGLVDEMVSEVGDAHGALPLVQFALDSLWETREDRTLRLAHYRDRGGALGALEHQAEALVAQWSGRERRTARRLLVRLVSTDRQRQQDFRQRLPVAELRPEKPERARRFDRVADQLIDAHLLLRTEDRSGELHLEVTHEALLSSWSRLGRWLEADHEMVVAMRQLDRWREEHEAGRRELLDAFQVAFARRVAKQFGRSTLPPAVRSYVRTSEAALEKRRFWRMLTAGSIALLVGGTAVVAIDQAVKAQARAEEAQQSLRRTTVQSMLMESEARSADAMAAMLRAAPHKDEIIGWTRVAYSTLARGDFESATYRPPEGERVIGWECGPGTAFRRRASAPKRSSRRRCSPRSSGTRFATVRDADHVVLVRDPLQDAPLASLSGHSATVSEASFSPDGTQLLTISDDGTARIWSPELGKAVHVLDHQGTGHHTARFSVSGDQVLTASSVGPTLIWSAVDATVQHTLPDEATNALSAVFLPGGELVATSGRDHAVDLWSVSTGALAASLDCGTGCMDEACDAHEPSLSIATSGDGKLLAATHHGQAHVWATDTHELVHSVPTGLDHADFVLLSPDGQHLALGYADQSIRVLELGDPALPAESQFPRLVNHFSTLDRATERDLRHTELAAFLPDKRTIGAVYSDGSARAWTWAGTSPATTLRHRDEAILRAGFTHAGERLTTASSDGTIRVWNLDGEEVDALPGVDDQVYLAAAISPVGDRAAAVGDDGSVSFWALGSRLHHVRRPATPRDPDTLISYAADGSGLITASPRGSVRIWTADGDADPVSLDLQDATVLLSARLSPDGAWAATVDRPHGVRVWRTADGELQRPQPGAIPEAWMATFSHDGEEIIVTTLEGAAAHNRSNVIVLDRSSRAPMAVLRGHEGPVYMADSGRGDLAVTASSDHSARVWDFGQFDRPARHTLPANGEQIIVDALFSPSGDKVATLDTSGTSRLWDSVSGSLLLDLSEFPDALTAQEVHLGPDHFATRSAEHHVELWPLSSTRISELLWAYSPVCLDAAERETMMGETRPMARKNEVRCLGKVARLRDDGVYAWLGPFQQTVGRLPTPAP